MYNNTKQVMHKIKGEVIKKMGKNNNETSKDEKYTI